MHLMIEGYHCSESKLDDVKLVTLLLNSLPDKLEIPKFSKPLVVRYEGSGWDKGGITGVVLISQSHFSIHTFPAHKFFTADFYSCKEFDDVKAKKIILETFNSKENESQTIIRGHKFEKELE